VIHKLKLRRFVRATKYGPPTFTGACSPNAAAVLTNESGERDLMTGVLYRLLIYTGRKQRECGVGGWVSTPVSKFFCCLATTLQLNSFR
jgi:hypothetical protein